MAFLALVKNKTLCAQIKQHAQHFAIEYAERLPDARTDYEAVLVEMGEFALPDIRDRWDTLIALVKTVQKGEEALHAGAADYILVKQLPLLLARRLGQYRQEAQYILEHSGDGTVIVDDDGIVRYCNPAAAHLLGYKQAELVGQNFGFPIVSEENTTLDLFRPGNAAPLVVEMRAVEMQWQGATSHLATLRDVTDRIQAEQDLRLRNRAMHASSSAIFILDTSTPDWKLTYTNPAFSDITGYKMSEVLNAPYSFLQRIHRTMPQPDDLLDMLENDNEFNTTSVSERKNGARYWSELWFSPIYDELKRLTHIVTIHNDVTQTKMLEQERLEREKIEVALQKERELGELKDRFLTMMAHELHTPLASIQLSYDMLTRYGDRATKEDRTEFLENILFQVNHLNSIVNDVLTISRTQKNALPLSPRAIDFVVYSRRKIKRFRKSRRRTHRIEFDTSVKDARVMLDEELFDQVIDNVLSNAIKFSSIGSEINVKLTVENEQAVMHIRDKGIGIPEVDQPRLFDPFHRGENVGNLPGTGLGLTLVERVVDAHHGYVEIRSREGQGTTVLLYLPLVDPA